ncbi:hypothetical protein ARGLB_035_00130 [Arthrobacter globiformis NBRC 12137]|uniref:Uncharacterized protein n=1 Tax=Arthrobacter globiformis (strain ATCC 8010 / DSM 20124 / JCM 1332 / NBRC 12137 / NCIMB 8907 / NRRL B-2979 / 168) TaxID=1077972 RepID=H0QJP8_ARTG1|nr:hypothetical protein ARGLB_035_00130 [Arthrobacter globiformis NBRC 12137]
MIPPRSRPEGNLQALLEKDHWSVLVVYGRFSCGSGAKQIAALPLSGELPAAARAGRRESPCSGSLQFSARLAIPGNGLIRRKKANHGTASFVGPKQRVLPPFHELYKTGSCSPASV